MELTAQQKTALEIITDEFAISVNDERLDPKIMNGLYDLGLITTHSYLGENYWISTDLFYYKKQV